MPAPERRASFVRTTCATQATLIVSCCSSCGMFIGASKNPQILKATEELHRCPRAASLFVPADRAAQQMGELR